MYLAFAVGENSKLPLWPKPVRLETLLASLYPAFHLASGMQPNDTEWESLEADVNVCKLPRGIGPGQSPLTVVADWLAEGGALAFTGAGISKESGVPTYRDGNGLWTKYDAVEVSSIGGFVGEPSKVWDFEREFNDLLQSCDGPNAGHRALSDLESLGCVDMVITQNVDGFHQASGSKSVLELHGSEVYALCLNEKCGKRTEMSRVFGYSSAAKANHSVWSPDAKGWGVRWPQGNEDTELQKTVRKQLEALKTKVNSKVDRKKGQKGNTSNENKREQSSSNSSSDSSSSTDSEDARRRARVRNPIPLTPDELEAGPPLGKVPICPECGVGILKPDGIFFGEPLKRAVLRTSINQSIKSKLVLVIGTSARVNPAAKLPLLARRKNEAKLVELNVKETVLSRHADIRLVGASAEILPKLLKLVAAHPRTAELRAQRGAKEAALLKLAEENGNSAANTAEILRSVSLT